MAWSHVDEGRREGGFGEAGDVAGANLKSFLGPEFRRWLMAMLSVGAEFEGMDVQGEVGVGRQWTTCNSRHRQAKLRCRDTSFRGQNNNPDPAFNIIQHKRAEAQPPNARDLVSNNGCFYNGAIIISLECNRRTEQSWKFISACYDDHASIHI